MGLLKISVPAKKTGKSLEVFKQRDGMNRSDQICIFKKIVWLVGKEWIIKGKSRCPETS